MLYLLKIIPMLMAGISLANTTFYYFNIDVPILSYIGGVSFLTLSFLYLASYIFRFCSFHRMFLHYVLIINILNIYDYYIEFELNKILLITIHVIITGIFLFLALYLKFK